MNPGHPTADLLFNYILNGTASAYAVMMDCDTRELRHALAALSTFRGPGSIARDITIALVRNELEDRA